MAGHTPVASIPACPPQKSLPSFLQIMRVDMAIDTDRPLGDHLGRMRFSVADPAGRPAWMPPPVAIGAGEIPMLGFRLDHQFANPGMTGYAEPARRCHGIDDLPGLMHRMAAKTLRYGLVLDMRLVALKTLRDEAMHRMTEGA